MPLELQDAKDHLLAKAAEIKATISDAQEQKTPITKKYAEKVWQDVKDLASKISTKSNIGAHLHQLTDPFVLEEKHAETILVNVAKFLENEAQTFKTEHLNTNFSLGKKKESK